MAAKKGAKRGKKKVTVEIDVQTLLKLAQVVEALSEVALATLWAVDDPATRRALTKKRGRSKKR
jgi:hypothetical protein